MEIGKKSLDLHEKNKGKLESHSKVSLKNKDDLSLAYTPGVAEVCREIYKNPSEAFKYTLKSNTVAVISDGSAVLGLGNIGPEAAIPVMEGKCVLFKEFANIDAFPICLKDQDIKKTIDTIKNIAPVFAGINLEDFKAPECFIIESSLQDLGIPVMHDDQHGTAVVALAGLINSIKLKNLKKEKAKIVINGVGAAGTAIAKLLFKYGFLNIVAVDSYGIIYQGRENLSDEKIMLSKITNKEKIKGDLSTALKCSDIFIGVSKANLLTKEMIKTMNKDPIIFALANPEPEIMPDLAKEAGAFIVATGRSDFPSQVNNVLAYPGIFRGAIDIKAKKISDEMKLAAAIALSGIIENPTPEMILPSPFDKKIVPAVSSAVKKAYRQI